MKPIDIKSIIQEMGLTQEEFARVIDKTPRAVSYYLSGKIDPPKKVVGKINEIFQEFKIRNEVDPLVNSAEKKQPSFEEVFIKNATNKKDTIGSSDKKGRNSLVPRREFPADFSSEHEVCSYFIENIEQLRKEYEIVSNFMDATEWKGLKKGALEQFNKRHK